MTGALWTRGQVIATSVSGPWQGSLQRSALRGTTHTCRHPEEEAAALHRFLILLSCTGGFFHILFYLGVTITALTRTCGRPGLSSPLQPCTLYIFVLRGSGSSHSVLLFSSHHKASTLLKEAGLLQAFQAQSLYQLRRNSVFV